MKYKFSFITDVNGFLKIPTAPRLLEKSLTSFPRLFWSPLSAPLPHRLLGT